jgi:hypothetical protein
MRPGLVPPVVAKSAVAKRRMRPCLALRRRVDHRSGPTLEWPKIPPAELLVDPVQTATGMFLCTSTMNLLCRMPVRDFCGWQIPPIPVAAIRPCLSSQRLRPQLPHSCACCSSPGISGVPCSLLLIVCSVRSTSSNARGPQVEIGIITKERRPRRAALSYLLALLSYQRGSPLPLTGTVGPGGALI